MGWVPVEKEKMQRARDELTSLVKMLNDHLNGRQWLVGN